MKNDRRLMSGMRPAVMFICWVMMAWTALAEGAFNVAWPPKNYVWADDKPVYLRGSVAPASATLLLNGEPVAVYRTGGFIHPVTLLSAQTGFTYELRVGDDSIAAGKWNVKRPSGKKVVPQPISGVIPKVDMGIAVGEPITISCRAEARAVIRCRVAGQLIELYPQDEGVRPLYQARVVINEVCEGAPMIFELWRNDKRIALHEGRRLTVCLAEQWPVYNVTGRHMENKARWSPGGDYEVFLEPGTQLRATGFHGKYHRLKLDARRVVYVDGSSLTKGRRGAVPMKNHLGNMHSEETDSEVLVRLDHLKPANVSWQYLDDNLLRCTLYNTVGSVDRVQLAPGGSLLSAWHRRIDGNSLELDLQLNFEPIYGYWISFDRFGAVLHIRKPWALRNKTSLVVAIDPGHGGSEAGAVAPTGTMEKDVNLALALQCTKALEQAGFSVRLLRSTDQTYRVFDRIADLQQTPPDLLISLHYNACPGNPWKARKQESYYYNPAGLHLGRFLHRELLPVTGLPDGGLRYGNLGILRNRSCPSVLLELDYFIIPEAEERSNNPDWQKRVAAAICRALNAAISETETGGRRSEDRSRRTE